jgi:hypothetical protein
MSTIKSPFDSHKSHNGLNLSGGELRFDLVDFQREPPLLNPSGLVGLVRHFLH